MKDEKSIVLYCYGTLRPGEKENEVTIPGVLFDCGSYPGLHLKGTDHPGRVVAERVVVSKRQLKDIDLYEGYRENDPKSSLFVRTPYLDGFIYQYNGEQSSRPTIVSYEKNGHPVSDYLLYRKQDKASMSCLVARHNAKAMLESDDVSEQSDAVEENIEDIGVS